MSSHRHRVLVFEDNPNNLTEILKGLKSHLTDLGVEIEGYDDSVGLSDDNKNEAVRDYLRKFLLEPDPAMVVLLDWEIHLLKHPIHKELVQGFCEQEGLPVCIYVNKEGRSEKVQNMKRWQETQISLDTMLTLDKISKQCAAIVTGFHEIWHAIDGETGIPDVGELTTKLLKPPGSAGAQLDQYSWGDTSALQVPQSDENHVKRFIVLNTGYWIFNRLLQFPGVLLNATAAASYLGIDIDDFNSHDGIREQFSGALYEGPFKDLGPYWWTTKIDDILITNTPDDADRVLTGLELVRQSVDSEVTAVECPGGGSPHGGAGYYCILTNQPVCSEHSRKPGHWLPPGADLCRIEMQEHAKWAPWLQL